MYISCINAASSHFYFPAELAGHFSNSISFAPGNHPVNCSATPKLLPPLPQLTEQYYINCFFQHICRGSEQKTIYMHSIS